MNSQDYTFEFREIVDLELIEILKKIEVHKASGVPRLSTFLLKCSLQKLVPQILHLMNSVIKTNVIPLSWKCAVITPLHKSGPTGIPDNYRPISVLPLMTKILEKCVHIQLSDYLERKKLLTDKQFGFRKNRSTDKAIATLLADVYNSINNNEYIKLCYIDLKKAFDTVSHNILLTKMESLGVCNRELQWFRNYLTDRFQHVTVNSTLSQGLWVECGVPQGSTLGPLLFIIYINDLTSYITNNVILFADDTVVYSADKNYNTAVSNLQKDLDIFALWSRGSQLTINAIKSKTMTIQPHNRKSLNIKNDIKLNDTILEDVSDYKYLGLKIDNKLNYKVHVNSIIRNVAGKISNLNRIKKCLSHKALINVYINQ